LRGVKVESGSDVMVDEVAEIVWWTPCVLIGKERARGDSST
jgi:hypothetical protein